MSAPLDPGKSTFTRVKGLWTHALVLGAGSPLVIVPGLGCASWMYVRVARELSRHHTVYIYDPPGHGLSEGRPEYPRSIAQLTDHLALWLAANALTQVPVLGHSLGGEVLFDLAARYPQYVRAAIACAPTGIPENPSVLVQLWRFLLNLPRERPALLWAGWRAYTVAGTLRIYRLAQDQTAHQTGPLLRQVRVPTLLIDGDHDPVIQTWTVQAIEDAIPNAVVCQISGGTHALTDSHPKTVARLCMEFLGAEASGATLLPKT